MQQPVLPILQPTSSLPLEAPTQNHSFDFMFILRMIFYLLVILKIIQLSFFRRRRFTIRERIYRKYLFANSEVLRSFSEQDKSIMQTTLNNTLKNATVEWNQELHRIRKTNKKVNFQTDKNIYIPPREREQNNQEFLDIKPEGQNDVLQDIEMEPDEDHRRLFEDKKTEDEFVEREDLLGLNQREIKLEAEVKKITSNVPNLQQAFSSQIDPPAAQLQEEQRLSQDNQ